MIYTLNTLNYPKATGSDLRFGRTSGLEKSLWLGHRLVRVSDSKREGAKPSYGCRYQEKRRIRRQTYRQIQEESFGFWNIARGPRPSTFQISLRKEEGTESSDQITY